MMKLPVQDPKTNNFQSLEDIQARKDELLEQLQTDNSHFGTKWNQLFVSKEDNSKTAFIGGLLVNSITVIDFILTARKLYKNYGSIFGLGKRKKKK
ncbi:MAG: hypothetical protein IJ190_12500 [Prevotella sp.]|nr:hypothetical protein [Prevotella sp.]